MKKLIFVSCFSFFLGVLIQPNFLFGGPIFTPEKTKKNDRFVTPQQDQICVENGYVHSVYVNQDCAPFVVVVNDKMVGQNIESIAPVIFVNFDGKNFSFKEMIPNKMIVPQEITPSVPSEPIPVTTK